jgi:hypothetical protein
MHKVSLACVIWGGLGGLPFLSFFLSHMLADEFTCLCNCVWRRRDLTPLQECLCFLHMRMSLLALSNFTVVVVEQEDLDPPLPLKTLSLSLSL